MTEPLDRENVIRLLDQLGGEQDAEVLDAARELHALIADAETDWDELLVADSSVGFVDTNDAAMSDNSDRENATAASPAGKNGKDAETLALIEKLLAKPDGSDALREELEEYKVDIANGEFGAKDHQYVRALYARLTK